MANLLQKVKNNYLKNKKVLIVLSALWIVFSVFSVCLYKTNLGKESSGTYDLDGVIELNRDTKIVQILDVVDGTDAISLCLNDYARINSGHITIEIKGNNSGKIYDTVVADIKSVDSERFNSYKLANPLNIDDDRTVTVTVTSDSEPGKAVGLFYTLNKNEETSIFTQNANTVEGSADIRLMFPNKGLTIFAYSIASIICLFGLIIILTVFLLEPKKEVIFTMIVLLFGLVMIVLINPISGPDEEYHYTQTLRLSNRLMGKEVARIEDRYVSTFTFYSNMNFGRGYKTILEIFNTKMDLVDRRIYSLREAPVYTYNLVYLPAAIGVTFARLFPLNYLKTCYCGRICNLLFYAVCVFFAVRKTPVMKTAFGIVASSVMFIQMAFVYGQDGWINGLSMLLFAHLLSWLFKKEKITLKDCIWVLVIDYLLAPAKSIYSLLALLFWFVSKDRFENQKFRNIVILLMMIPIIKEVGGNIFQRVSSFIFTSIHAETIAANELTTPIAFKEPTPFGMSYILTHIDQTIAIIIHTIITRATTWIYGMFGRYLSGLSLTLPLGLSRILILLPIAAAMIYEENHLSVPFKLSTVVICVAISGLIMMTMLVGWTKTTDDIVQGIQGRYFSPLIIYLVSIFSNGKIGIPKKTENYFIMVHLCVLVSSLLYVMSYTFVNF